MRDNHVFANGDVSKKSTRTGTTFKLYDLDAVRAAIGDNVPEELSIQGTEHYLKLAAIFARGEAGTLRHTLGPTAEMPEEIDSLIQRAPHFREFSDLVVAHAISLRRLRLPMAFNPVLLVGEPGVGKSWMLSHLAKILGLPFRSYSMSISTLGDGISGSHPCWRNSDMGLVAKTLLHEDVGNPVIFVDEFDKVSASSDWNRDPYRPFYTFLDPSCSVAFIDEYLGFPINASQVLWVMAANDTSRIPAPIMDRLSVIHVPSPTLEQRYTVINSIYGEANATRKSFFAKKLKQPVLDKLVTLNPRGVRIAIETGMAFAAADGRRVLQPNDIKSREAKPRFKAGFC
jgi:ATP-dependent Lon protease